MGTRFDHLVIAVPDLDDAVERWTGAGLAATIGGRHPGGTQNALVRGPGPSYVELITAASDASGAWADRVRGQHGYLSWAVAVDDLDAARARLVAAGFTPAEIVDGSRETPDGSTIRWRLLQVGERAFDPDLPFLIEWVAPMPPGPPHGPVLEHVRVVSPDPERLATMLEAVGLPRDRGFDDDRPPRWWSFGDPDDTRVAVIRAERGGAPSHVDDLSLALAVPVEPQPDASEARLEGIDLHLRADVRAHPAHQVLVETDRLFARRSDPTPPWPPPHPHRAPLEAEYSRLLDPGKYRILTERATAWIEALTGLGLATAEELDPRHAAHSRGLRQAPAGVTRLSPRVAGAVPLVIVQWDTDGELAGGVTVVAGEGTDAPPEGHLGLPDCGCDACDDGSESLLRALDEEILVVLGGGVLRVTEGSRIVTRTLDGWGASGSYAQGEPERWLAGEAPTGATVVAGEPWV